jgi:K(+)-stimulated pyrophosphate-energized sodium pump
MKESILYIVPVLGLLGLIIMAVKSKWVSSQSAGNERMQGIAKNIQDGALAFLRAEYRILAVFVVIASIALFFISQYSGALHLQETLECVLQQKPM